MIRELCEIIKVDKEKCVNCHSCISVCPAKFCNDGSGDYINYNKSLCVGCSQCIKACTHDARTIIDDTDAFLRDLSNGVRVVAVVAPAVAVSFPGEYLYFNGWLKSAGVSASFDVSFGAELTIKSYLEHVKANSPKLVIAQPCPALVTYIQIYRPELLSYLAPAHSPMLHTVQMVKEYYPQYRNHKIAIMSPCVAKKREFEETSLGDYNVTFQALNKYFRDKNINLRSYRETDYDNPPAERAVLFSTPGGLLRTAERWNPDIRGLTRKIEGPHIIYEYLDHLPDMVRKGFAPLLVDCLNCDLGCNGGTATENYNKSPDEVEALVEKRNKEMQKKYRKSGPLATLRTNKALEQLVTKYWKPGLYDRKYLDLSQNFTYKKPDNSELNKIYKMMGKNTEKDILNCGSCGYGKCEHMAMAIHNGLNKHENCHHYLVKQHQKIMVDLEEEKNRQLEKVNSINRATIELTGNMNQITVNMEEMVKSIQEISKNTQEASKVATMASDMATGSAKTVDQLRQSSDEIGNVIDLIKDTADQLHLLALNATIESSRAGAAGRGFAVVANEVKELANETGKATKNIRDKISTIQNISQEVVDIISNIADVNRKIYDAQLAISSAIEEQTVTTNEVKRSISEVSGTVNTIAENASVTS